MCWTIERELQGRNGNMAEEVRAYLWQWAFDCVWWERYAIAELTNDLREKCRLSQRMTRIYLDTTKKSTGNYV